MADIAVGLLAVLILQEINHRSTKWAIGVFGPGVYRPELLGNILPRSRRQWILAPLALIPAALVEELLFRSLAIGGLSLWVDPVVLAVVFSVVFGAAHLPQGRLGVVGAGSMGLALSALFLWRWSMLACLVAHYGVNLVQLVRGRSELAWFGQASQVS